MRKMKKEEKHKLRGSSVEDFSKLNRWYLFDKE